MKQLTWDQWELSLTWLNFHTTHRTSWHNVWLSFNVNSRIGSIYGLTNHVNTLFFLKRNYYRHNCECQQIQYRFWRWQLQFTWLPSVLSYSSQNWPRTWLMHPRKSTTRFIPHRKTQQTPKRTKHVFRWFIHHVYSISKDLSNVKSLPFRISHSTPSKRYVVQARRSYSPALESWPQTPW